MNLGIVIPVFDDWVACSKLIAALGEVLAETDLTTKLFIVDDGSTIRPTAAQLASSHFDVDLIELVCNVGNQRAIALGLCVAQQDASLDAVAVMDGDGEDRPEDLMKLVSRLRENQSETDAIVVARRDVRSEGPIFRAFYRGYRLLFRALTGQTIRFGNFSLIPRAALDRLVYIPDIWNNLAAAIHRARQAVEPVRTARGLRYAGRSSTSLVSLIVHGLSSVSVYSDVVFVRVLLFSIIVGSLAFAGILAALWVKFMTELATPGWTTAMVGSLGIISLQLVMLSVIASFLHLSSRTNAVMVPAMRAREYIKARHALGKGSPVSDSVVSSRAPI